MNYLRGSNAGDSRTLAPDVSLVRVFYDDYLLKRVALAAAESLVARGWGEWIGRGRRRYVRLSADAPLSALHGFRGHDGTTPVLADQTCKIYRDRQPIGNPDLNREFLPLS